ncbi:dinucleotide-binding enzyme [Hymenobacter amundsenii]|uniref:Dinucleotide-binding enzyme n=1 Tax=Hymenobacter amundsenii TaxID=2006685 RepID=A0A246FIN5_9BACT|nr:NAD(P)-binding domain-containing protein [Hymenobacter amundsenii]OWP61495.1 dinucleotide-binding enzyme [Hymenobacter amundsenii]
MNIGIIGAGQIGGKLARLLAPHHHLLVSFSRSPEKLAALARQAGPSVQTGTPAEAAAFADVLILSVHFAAMDDALAGLGNVAGQVLIDTNNPFDIQLPAGVTAAQEVLRRLPGVRLVKAFNTLPADVLRHHNGQQPPLVVPLSGDDAAAKTTVARLILDAGFAPFDLGGLDAAAMQEPNGSFYNQQFTLEQARQQYYRARL